MRDYLRLEKIVHFVFPIDGDCLNEADGVLTEEGLKVKVTVKAPKDADIYVNDVKLTLEKDVFVGEVLLRNFRTVLEAKDHNNYYGEDVISVFKLNDVMKKFRLSSDDNIIFLKDINDNKDVYKSIFDNPYLKMYKRVHDETGACIHLNLFYENMRETDNENYFNLSMMTDKFKDEWIKNADWLHLGFHSYANDYWPYKHTTHTQITEEALAVHNNIIRFAGIECFPHETTIHFGSVNETGVRAMRSLGIKALAGYFEFDTEGNPLVSYFYQHDLINHVGERDFWVDTLEDVFYARIDRVLNLDKTVEGNLKFVKDVMANPTRGGWVELMIHEQYFYETYGGYIKDFGEIVYQACKTLKDAGYTSAFICDAIKEF